MKIIADHNDGGDAGPRVGVRAALPIALRWFKSERPEAVRVKIEDIDHRERDGRWAITVGEDLDRCRRRARRGYTIVLIDDRSGEVVGSEPLELGE